MAAGKDQPGVADALVLSGLGVVAGGLYVWHPVAGVVAIGVTLIAFGLLLAYRHG